MTFQCRDCDEWVERIEAGRFKSGGRRFVNTEGKTWGGYICPSCKFMTNNSPALKIEYPIKRSCRGCNKELPPTRYFYHDLCMQAEVPYGGDEYGSAPSWVCES